ncbi:MAG: PQQ-dependent sugar dehydrogenase [Sedimentisphaerales bacterium]|nr:PQQ-dependent sugar dehydrogenase [Sedimentisphaerales bacterium]
MRNTTTIITYFCIVIVAFSSIALGIPPTPADSGITVRPGFSLTIAIDNLERPRFMEAAPDGTLFISFPQLGQIKSCKDSDGDGSYESLETFVDNHPTVHGLYWHDGWLWFTESGAIFRARDDNNDGRADTEETVIPAGQLPKGGGHWWRSLLIHNQRLYTSIGDSGNINDESTTERQKIWSFKLDGTDKQLFCTGIRNTEKLVARPGTNEIWGMDHGSDRYGKFLEDKDKSAGQPITDLNPPCEMNHYIQDGFYGHPFVVGNRLVRYEFMERPDIVKLAAKTIPPAWATGGHWAPNAMEFYTGSQFPKDCQGDAFVAYHGSWNSSLKVGYCVTRVLFDAGKPYGELKVVDFLDKGGSVLGRPVDVVNTPDGSILISDDHGGKIYRLSYQPQDEKK